MVHLLISYPYIAITFCSKDFPNRRAFAYLGELLENRSESDSDEEPEPPSKSKLKSITRKYNDDRDGDAFTTARENLGEVKNLALNNIDKVLDNQQKVDELMFSSESLLTSGNLYRIRGNQVRRKMLTRNLLLILLVVFILVGVVSTISFLLYVIIASATSGDDHDRREDDDRKRILQHVMSAVAQHVRR